MVLLFFLLALASAQKCLPGQQPCLSTCCNTNQNYTCCPYNGGYCAPPTSICCPKGPGGLCDAGDGCCHDVSSGSACYNKTTQECCGFGSICGKGDCCADGDGGGVCLTNNEKCCEDSFDDGFPCPEDTTCCGPYTVYGGSQDCCAKGLVCCPSWNDIDWSLSVNKKKAAAAAAVTGLRKRSNQNVTSCADPNKDFCCAGYACPTETLCCPGNVQLQSKAGCCYGISSKDHSCATDENGDIICPSIN